jgi:hypothetical protein
LSGTSTFAARAILVADPDLVALEDVIAQINDLFSGDHPDSSVRNVVTHVKDRLEESETLKQQAPAKTSPNTSGSAAPPFIGTSPRTALPDRSPLGTAMACSGPHRVGGQGKLPLYLSTGRPPALWFGTSL